MAARRSDQERWARIEEIFRAALERSAEERAALLAASHAEDPELAAEVAALLAADAQAGEFLAAAVRSAPADAAAGGRIGPYRIERELGRGGTSVVYLAARDDDQFRQQVAIKLLDHGGGLQGEELRRRFHRERQILAGLEHPNIARLFDGGTTSDGRPYFVLEPIAGEPIDAFCDRRRLPVAARLRLFLAVCSAVSYAHRSLVVHRDLKPSNVLVTADGTPKLLDFGIAKLLDPAGGPDAAAVPTGSVADPTRAELRVMTPAYASPEQRRGGTITTASDVYSLGVVLYELLTGRRPRRPAGEAPERPSAAVLRAEPEAVARARGCQPRELQRRLRGDLDNVLSRALAEDPARRYGSVEQLAQDLERHLESRPVSARPDTFAYRAAKHLRRHRAAVAAGAGFVALLAAFAVSTAVQSARTARERDKAERSLDFLVDLFQVADPSAARGSTLTVRELLDRGAARVEGGLSGQPQVQAVLMETLGRIYGRLGIYDRGEKLLRQALALRTAVLGRRHLEVAQNLNSLGDLLQIEGEYDRAEAAYREALAIRRRLLGGDHPDVATSLNSLADLLQDKGDYRAAEPLYRQALAMRLRLFGRAHADVAASLNNLALLLHDRGDYRAAEPLYREALATRRRLLGKDHPEVASSLINLATLLQAEGELKEPEPLLREALAIRRRLLGAHHADVAASLQYLGMLLYAKGNLREAEADLREAVAVERAAAGPDHPDLATIDHDLGLVLVAKGETSEAEEVLRRSIALYRRRLPPHHPYLSHPLVALGRLLTERGAAAAAEPLLAEALDIRRRGLPSGSVRTAEAAGALGACRAALGRRAEAEPLLAESYETYRRALGDADPRTRQASAELASLRAGR